jgi:hypothetical protein
VIYPEGFNSSYDTNSRVEESKNINTRRLQNWAHNPIKTREINTSITIKDLT